MFTAVVWQMLYESLLETLLMVIASLSAAVVIGGPLGVLLVTTGPRHLLEQPVLNRALAAVVNAGRSIPFIILMVAIIPFTRLVAGTSIGTTAAIVPLGVAAIPFFARLVESSLREVDRGVIEAAQAMGASPWTIIFRVMIPEALSSITLGVTITAVTLVSYSAMAGAIGGGGLGDLAVRYGYQRFRGDIMLLTVVILILVVQGMQFVGDRLAEKLDKRSL